MYLYKSLININEGFLINPSLTLIMFYVQFKTRTAVFCRVIKHKAIAECFRLHFVL